jgi:hypothetical protein
MAIAYSKKTVYDRMVAATLVCEHFKEEIDRPGVYSHLKPLWKPNRIDLDYYSYHLPLIVPSIRPGTGLDLFK